MAIESFVPEVWADTMLDRWADQTVVSALVSNQYQGLATRGNTVKLTGVVAPAVKDYKAAGRVSVPDDISDTGIDLLIDQEKEYSFYVDDIDTVQAAGSLGVYTDAAADALVEDANRFIVGRLVAGGSPLGGPAPVGAAQAFDAVRDAWKAMSKATVPAAGRSLICNSEFAGLLLGSDSKLTAYDQSGDGAGLRGATIGSLLGFRVVVCDGLPQTDTPAFVAVQQRAAAYVSQIEAPEALRAQNKFADIVRGLHVYGATVTKPDGVWFFGLAPAGTATTWHLTVTGGPDGGTFTLTVDGATTDTLAHDASNTAIAAALNALPDVTGAKVTGTATKTVVFKDAVALSATGALTGGSDPTVTVEPA